MMKVQRGFSLLEGLISLFLFLLIMIFSLECFLNVRRHFAKLKESESSNTAVYAALDRVRRDVLDAGLGLVEAMMLQVLEGIREEQGRLIVLSKERDLLFGEALFSGQQRIPITEAQQIKKGQLISILGLHGGEVHSVVKVDSESVVIDSPLAFDYKAGNARIFLLRQVALFLDDAAGAIRRKVNASPAQPLLEDVASFAFQHLIDDNLVRIYLSLETEEEKKYGITVFPKNTAMASIRQSK